MRLRGMNINVPLPSEHSTFRKSPSEGSAKSSDRSSDLDPSDSPSKFKATLSKLTSSSLSSLPKRNYSTSFDPDQQGYNDIRFLAELVKPLQYRLRVSKKERKEKVIIPSKHGYHPRSQSPTFKRLLEATEKLNVLCENDSLEGQVRRDYSHINNDVDAPLVPLKNGERLARVTNARVKPSHTTPYITDVTTNTNTVPKTDNIHTIPEKLEIPKHFPKSEDVISEEGDITDSSSTKSDEAYFKVDFKEEDAHAELHLFLPYISEPVTGRGTSPESKNGATNGKAGNGGRVTLPSIPRQSNMMSQKTFSKKANNKNTVKKKKKKMDNRCPSAKDNDRKVNDHLNDVPTLISMNYENGHHERRDPHADDTICDVANCPFHSLMAVARAETYV
ncbi:uncharacterized protein LOC110465391 isoform X2 [Mizuhopecten yessoensis]|uniref:uncharacterized protein LOC110465391 isoform X2 n=1 Tax=Mizuhopecten yessoensis TaxID=6573 RepID=UPI000B45F05F|nr:uncharacterized protein LOC110465391 isoform X2 [Mizuhopecten yessoensis]